MATIADLHLSISEMTEEELFSHIRHIRSLRREIPERVIKKAVKKTSKKKINKKQITIDEYLNNIKNDKEKKEELLKKLLKIKGEK